MSYIEFFGVISGLFAVWLSARANIWSWPIGIINVTLAFILYFQVQLFPDSFLQIFFFITNLLGWWRWAHPKLGEADKKSELKISYMKRDQLLITTLAGLLCTFLLGKFASHLHDWLPSVFSMPSAYPFIDSFITVMSVITTFYMIQKKVECWIIWILIDVVATILYYIKGVKFFSFEYLVFTFLAAYGLFTWIKEFNNYKGENNSVEPSTGVAGS